MSRTTREEWNNGTIYRVHVDAAVTAPNNTVANTFTVKLDIAQSELVGKVYIGVENYVLDKQLFDPAVTTQLTDFANQNTFLIENWAKQTYLKMRSSNLPPDIDYETDVGRNTQCFARLPLKHEYLPKESGAKHPMNPRTVGDYTLHKDGILYEMSNNPTALSNGQITIQLLRLNDQLWDVNLLPIYNFSFTLVIYKPRNTYS